MARLREDPSGGEGYGITFHAVSGEFGLVLFSKGGGPPLLVSLHDGCFDALEAM